MRKIISAVLATLMLSASFASCAPADQLDPAITLASSDATAYAEWLDGRLDVIPDDVIIGVGSNEAYGIDMTNFESDGYILREIEGDVLIFGASAKGTDRAVRAYAKAAEINQTANLNETYHEGARIKRLTVAGRDISEFTIVHAEGDSYLANGANTLNSRLNQACGVTLPISTAPVEGAVIEFRWVTDETLKTVGSRWTVEDGKILLECSDGYKNTSPIFAALRFLEKQLDWFGITYGDYDLPAADHIDISAGNGTEINTFNHTNIYGVQYHGWDPFDYTGTSYGPIGHCCHGMQSNRFAGELSNSPNKNWQNDQPCYTDAEFYDLMRRDVAAYIDRHLASGYVVGENFYNVDIAAGDNSAWCTCSNCRQVYREEGGTHAGPVVRWANKLSEDLNSVPEYAGMTYGIFAYAGTNKAPRKTAPNEFIYVTYCTDWCCAVHPLNGESCTTGAPVDYPKSYEDNRSNSAMSRFLREWTRISDNIFVWHYGLTNAFLSISYVHNVYEDIKFFYDLGVYGIMYEAEDPGYGTGRAAKFLMSTLLWNIDEVTPEVFKENYYRVLKTMYGEGWENVDEYITGLTELHMKSECASCWFWNLDATATYDAALYAEKYDRFFEILEEAIPMAESAIQQRRLEALQCYNIYNGSVSSYFTAYEAGDDERCAELSDRYDLINERLSKYGVDMTTPGSLDPCWQCVYETDLELQMWLDGNVRLYMDKWQGVEVTREMPERVAEYIESMAAATETE